MTAVFPSGEDHSPLGPPSIRNRSAQLRRFSNRGNINYWTGPAGRRFDQAWADYCGTRYGLGLANGTVALELAVKALGIGPGDDVVVTPRSFIASVACVTRAGARPIFADVDRDSQNITPASISAVLTPATKAILPVHLGGWPCDMPGIMELAQRNGVAVIEDGAQAHGAVIDGRRIGSFGTIGAFSFCQDKIVTTGGEGGAIVTDESAIWESLWAERDHGRSFRASDEGRGPAGNRWVHESFGGNARLTEFQSTLGLLQIDRLPEWLRLRRRNARVLEDAWRDLDGLRIPVPPGGIEHAAFRFYAFVEPGALAPGWNRGRIMAAVRAEGVPVSTGTYSEIYREDAYVNQFGEHERLPVAQELGQTGLAFLVHPTLETSDMEEVAEAVTKVVLHATNSPA